jgi:hypothetical protein
MCAGTAVPPVLCYTQRLNESDLDLNPLERARTELKLSSLGSGNSLTVSGIGSPRTIRAGRPPASFYVDEVAPVGRVPDAARRRPACHACMPLTL